MPNAAAQAYTRVANSTSSPRDIEALALLMAANKLQDVITNADPTGDATAHALMFNRKLWSVFLGEALNDGNPQPVEVRQKIANIGIFMLTQTMALQISPRPDHFKSLIGINRNIAAGLGGRE
jgi:flagellar protein FlaF